VEDDNLTNEERDRLERDEVDKMLKSKMQDENAKRNIKNA
jgi:hypothetical protein